MDTAQHTANEVDARRAGATALVRTLLPSVAPLFLRLLAVALLLLFPPSAPADQATAQPATGATRTAPSGGPKQMRITRAGTQPSQKGPAEWFTGTVRIDPLFPANEPARAAGAQVTF